MPERSFDVLVDEAVHVAHAKHAALGGPPARTSLDLKCA
jgi:hypothetical protein